MWTTDLINSVHGLNGEVMFGDVVFSPSSADELSISISVSNCQVQENVVS